MTAWATDFYNTNGATPAKAAVPAASSGGAPTGPASLGLNVGTQLTADHLTVLAVLALFGVTLLLLHAQGE